MDFKKRSIVVVGLLCLMMMSAASFAATKPLSFPYGMVVDSKGDLFVANYGQNNILVYGPNYNQLTAKTLVGLNGPQGVALDSYGDVWACNFGDTTIAEFLPGKTNAVGAAFAVVPPTAISIDGSNNLWVGGAQGLGVFDQTGRLYTPVAQKAGTLSYGLATHWGWVAMGGNSGQTLVTEISALLLSATTLGTYLPGDGIAIGVDSSDNFYIANSDGSVNVYNPNTGAFKNFLTLAFTPGGIAVDSVRGRVYLSDSGNSKILVYSTAGTLLHTIE